MTIEDAAELRLRQRHVVRLESRPANVEGRGEVTIRQLVVNALRMRPDRIVVGEVRGAEALDMLQALNTGHDGSLTTVHANSPADALRRIETLALMAGVGLPHAAIRDQVASALDVVVHQARLPDGSRVVESVSEVLRVAGGAGTRELWTRGGRLREPGPGDLASRLAALRAGMSAALAFAGAPSCAVLRRCGISRPAPWPGLRRGAGLARARAGCVWWVRRAADGRPSGAGGARSRCRRAPPVAARWLGCCVRRRPCRVRAARGPRARGRGAAGRRAGAGGAAASLPGRGRRGRSGDGGGDRRRSLGRLLASLGRCRIGERAWRRGRPRAPAHRRRAGGRSADGRCARGHAPPGPLAGHGHAGGRLPASAARRRRSRASAPRQRPGATLCDTPSARSGRPISRMPVRKAGLRVLAPASESPPPRRGTLPPRSPH